MRSLLKAATVACVVVLFAFPAFAYDAHWASTFAGVGFDGPVNTMADWNGNLVVGGNFAHQSMINAVDVARWDGASWHAMGYPGWVYTTALADYNGTLYGHGFWGGAFIPRHFLAWNPGTETWDTVADFSISQYLGVVNEMVVYDGKLVIGGDVGIDGPDGFVANLFYYDGTDFRSVGNGPNLSSGGVGDMVEIGGVLYVAGIFDMLADSTAARGLAAWDGTTWSPVFGKSSPAGPLVEGVWDSYYGPDYGGNGYAVAEYQGKLVVAGEFDRAGDLPVSNIVMWDPATQMWDSLGGGSPDILTSASAYGADLYVGSSVDFFSSIGGVPVENLARWDGASWSDVAGGTSASVNDMSVYAGSLVLGGDFQSAGGVQCERLAWWNGTAFQAHHAPGGLGLDGQVRALAVHGGNLVAVGAFDYGGTTPLGGIGAWDDSGWSDFAGGANDDVSSVLSNGTDLVVAGDFTEIGGAPAAYIARWDGSSWHPYGAGLPAPARAIAVHDGQVAAAGGQVSTKYLKRWDGAAWQDTPLPATVATPLSLASFNGELILGASYFNFGGAYTYVARWNGVDWNPLLSAYGYSVNDFVYGFRQHAGQLYMSGSFFYVENIYPNGGWTETLCAAWDGATLTRLEPINLNGGSGTELNVTYAIAWYDGNRFIGGSGSYNGGRLWSNDGVETSWQLVGGDVLGVVFDLKEYQGRLFVAGSLQSVGTTGPVGGTPSAGIGALSADVTAVGPPGAAAATVLEQNHPNPFNPTTAIRYRVAERGRVTLRIYSVSGAVVRTLVDAVRDPGVEHTVSWDGTDDAGRAVASGLYFYRLTTNGTARTRKMVLLK